MNIKTINQTNSFYHGSKHLGDKNTRGGQISYLSENKDYARSYCDANNQISTWRPSRPLKLMKLTKSNIELLLNNIPEDAYIDINIADKAFKQYLSPKELEMYMNTGKRYVKHSKRNWKLKVLSDIPWKYLMNISREEWSRRLLPKKNYMYNTKTGELVKAISSSGVGYFKNTLGHDTLPPIFISNDNANVRLTGSFDNNI